MFKDCSGQALFIFGFKWQSLAQKAICDDSKSPYVHFLVVSFVFYHLRGPVVNMANLASESFAMWEVARKAEVSDLNSGRVSDTLDRHNQDTFCGYIPMHDVLFVKILETEQYLIHHVGSF